jgi:hypothetical protein
VVVDAFRGRIVALNSGKALDAGATHDGAWWLWLLPLGGLSLLLARRTI